MRRNVGRSGGSYKTGFRAAGQGWYHRPMFLAPFLALYLIFFFVLLAFLFAMVQIGAISYAFHALGLPPGWDFIALFASLVGSYINIPITRIEGGMPHPGGVVTNFGMRYRVPVHLYRGSTVVAFNVGGAMVPVLISLYVLVHQPAVIVHALIATVIVAFVVNRVARPVPGMGIATPMFVPPIIAVLSAWLVGPPAHYDAVAYVGGVIGTLIGADLLNLNRLGNLGAPVASIGGAGTFDGIFLTGIIAVLLA